jgi:hypothetical protein
MALSFENESQKALLPLLKSVSESLSAFWTEACTIEQVIELTADAGDSMRAYYWIAFVVGPHPGPDSARLHREQLLDAIKTRKVVFLDRNQQRAVVKALLYMIHYPDQDDVQAEFGDWDFIPVKDRCLSRASAMMEREIVEQTTRACQAHIMAVTEQIEQLFSQRQRRQMRAVSTGT